MKTILFLLFASLLFFSCPKVPSEDFNLGEPILLELNKSTMIGSEKVSMLLTSVDESRCPKDVMCVRAGEAFANIDFMVEDAVSAIRLKADGSCFDENGKCGNTTTAQGYKIKLLYIYPYPMNNPPSGKDFSAKVIITR